MAKTSSTHPEMAKRVIQRISKRSLESCSSELCARIDTAEAGGKWSGIERVFGRAIDAAAEADGVFYAREVPLADLGGTTYAQGRESGLIDCVVKIDGVFVGLEHKVLRLPRKRNTHPSGSLYDLGQITADWLRLKSAKGLSGGFCLLLLHGPLVRDSKSALSLQRHCHNQLFIDFRVSSCKGEFAEDKAGRRAQIAATKSMEFDQPYLGSNGRSHDFAVRSSNGILGVIGIWTG